MSAESTTGQPDGPQSGQRLAPQPPAPQSGPQLNTEIADRAARLARSAGAWSLAHLRICWIALIAGSVVLGVVAGIVAGGRAVLGVAVGAAIVGLFFTISAVIVARVGERNPKKVLVTALGVYLIKIVALGIVMVSVPRNGALDTRWMAGAVAVGLVCWMAAHLRYVWTAKILYVDATAGS